MNSLEVATFIYLSIIVLVFIFTIMGSLLVLTNTRDNELSEEEKTRILEKIQNRR